MKKDNSKFWCKFCRVFVYDNKISRSNHDKQSGHKANVDRFIREIESKKAQELKTTNMAKQLLGIPITERSSTGNSSVYIPTSNDLSSAQSAPIVKFKETKSTVGQVGDWETVDNIPESLIETGDSIDLGNDEGNIHRIDHLGRGGIDGIDVDGKKDVKDKILQLTRSVLSTNDSMDSLNTKSAAVEAKGEFTIKKRVFKGKLKKS